MNDADLLVIGGGAAGLAVAREGIRRGARTVLVTKGPPGGDCTFTGCVPSKTFLESAARGDGFGDAMSRVRTVIGRIASTEDADALKREGIDVISGSARFRNANTITVDGSVIGAQRIVIATGCVAVIPALPGIAGVPCVTTDDVWSLDRRPETLVVLGGGPVGCELAQAFARFGTRVTLAEASARLLPHEEPEASQVVTNALADDGVIVHSGAEAVGVRPRDGGLVVDLGPWSVDAHLILVTAGRAPATGDLDLEAAGVRTDERGYVRTSSTLRTTASGVYAAGDVTGRMPFTHAADEMGRLAARNALSKRPTRFDAGAIPRAIFTDPEVARVGLTEREAAGGGVRVAYLPMTEVDRAIAAERERGFVKLIAGPRPLLGNAGGGRLLGATVVCARGGELIHEAAVAMRTRLFLGRLAQTVHAYPTWSTAVRMAAAQFFTSVHGRTARAARS